MAKIHGLVYILVGAIVSFVSWKVDFNDLIIFFYIGIGFGVVGFLKIFIDLARKNEEEKTNNSANEKHLNHARQRHQSKATHQQNAANHAQRQAHHQPGQIHPSQQRQHYKRCQNCGNAARIQDNFCSNCGYSV